MTHIDKTTIVIETVSYIEPANLPVQMIRFKFIQSYWWNYTAINGKMDIILYVFTYSMYVPVPASGYCICTPDVK